MLRVQHVIKRRERVALPGGIHYVHWRVVNDTHEIHPYHIHQVHFLVYRENGSQVQRPEWLDTVNVSPGGSVNQVMDFTDPIIRECRSFIAIC
jgi:FtsP/CotA-like multicopper oxidase with cupredoxin domain